MVQKRLNKARGNKFVRRRAVITVDVSEDGLSLLDAIKGWMQQTELSTRAVTRSTVVREAIQCLYDRISEANKRNPEVTAT